MASEQVKHDYACFLIADDTSEYGNDSSPEKESDLKTLLKHTLMFNVFDQKLMFSDSHLLNNDTLRNLLKKDDDVQKMFRSQMLGVAVRADEDGNPLSPDSLVREFEQRGIYRYNGTGHDELYPVWDKSHIVPFQLNTLGVNFETEALKIFRGNSAKKRLTPRVSNRVHEFSQMEKKIQNEKGETLNLGFFYKQLEDKLGKKDWAKYGEEIYKLAKAPYQAGMPKFLGADPIYAREHAEAFDLLRGQLQRNKFQMKSRKFEGKLGLAAFRKGVELLSVNVILELLDSDEAQEYQLSRDELMGTDESTKRMYEALAMYVYLIESKILNSWPGLKQESMDGLEKEIGLTIEEWLGLVEGVVDFASVFFVWVGAPKYLLNKSFLDKLNQAKAKQKVQQKAAIKNQEKDRVLRELENTDKAKNEFELTSVKALEAKDFEYDRTEVKYTK